MKNDQRAIVASVQRYCERHGYRFAGLSHDWILSIDTGRKTYHVFGYDLGLNSSVTHRICNDKAATFEVLQAAGIAALEHRFFIHPRLLHHVGVDGNWPGMLRAFEDFGGDVVVKDNEGTGGVDLYRARSISELERQVSTLFSICRGVAISPFTIIDDEVRFVLHDGERILSYRKKRPELVGDGRSSVNDLIAAATARGVLDLAASDIDLPLHVSGDVPAAGELVPLQWRHNLGRGARPLPVSDDDQSLRSGIDLASRAAEAVGLRFGAVDVLYRAGVPSVMEINSGIMLENAAVRHHEGLALVDRVYHRVLDQVTGRQ